MNQKELKIVLSKIEGVYENSPRPVATYFQETTQDPFKVLISTMLSPRARDSQTERVAKELFKVADTPEKLSRLSLKEIETIVYSIGFYKTKAKRIKNAAKIVIEQFKGKVPSTLEELLEIQGVGRKVANIILAECYGQDSIGVDVHTLRIPNRLGLIKTKTPLETEKQLMQVIPKDQIRYINRYLVAFGQNICLPLSPLCSRCPIEKYCPKLGVTKKR